MTGMCPVAVDHTAIGRLWIGGLTFEYYSISMGYDECRHLDAVAFKFHGIPINLDVGAVIEGAAFATNGQASVALPSRWVVQQVEITGARFGECFEQSVSLKRCF